MCLEMKCHVAKAVEILSNQVCMYWLCVCVCMCVGGWMGECVMKERRGKRNSGWHIN